MTARLETDDQNTKDTLDIVPKPAVQICRSLSYQYLGLDCRELASKPQRRSSKIPVQIGPLVSNCPNKIGPA